MIIVEDNGEQKTNEAYRERQSPDSGGVMLDCYNQRAVEDYSVTITTRINSANHYYVIEENEREMENEIKVIGKLRSSQDAVIDNLGSYKPNGYNGSCVIGEGGIAPTVRENHGEVTAVLEPKIIGYTRDREKGNVVNRTIKDESGTIHSSTGGGGNTSQFVLEPKYRIRKLTPRECFRLMDVDDADIDKIQGAGICNSQQYKLAGNSIAISPLYHIFRKMFVEQGNEEQQLKLF